MPKRRSKTKSRAPLANVQTNMQTPAHLAMCSSPGLDGMSSPVLGPASPAPSLHAPRLSCSWPDLLGWHMADCAKMNSTARTSVKVLDNTRVVGFYFGSCAGWCAPCEEFTPILKSAFKAANKASAAEDRPNFDVVYVPLDRTQEEWHRSVKGMPWKSLMWGERTRTAALMKRFDVRTIPFLVLLKGDCSIITSDGVKRIEADSNLELYPWSDVTWQVLLGSTFLRPISVGNGTMNQRIGADVLGSGVLLLLFANRSQIPQVKKFVAAYTWLKEHPLMNSRCNEFEALFVSNDRIYDDYAATFTQILWPAIPFEKTARRRAALASRFDVPEGAFRLIVVSGAGKVLNPDAMAAITAQNNFEGYPWESNPEPLPTMTSRAVQCLDTVSGCTIS